MLNSIKQWFSPSVFEGDEEKTHHASLLNLYTIIFILFAIIVMAGNLLGGRTPTRSLLINALVILFGLALRYWLYQGNIKFVGIGAISLTFIGVTAGIASTGTIRAPITASYIFVVILVGVLYDWRGILASALICSLAVSGLILAEQAGILPQPDYTVTITQWVTYTALFALIASLVYSNNQITRKALARAEQEIAERRRVEMDLRKLSLAVEQSPASILITDLDGKIEYVNPRFTQVTGYSFKEAIGKNPRILKTGKTPPETHRQLWETILTGKEWRGEFINHKKDGSLYYESAIISPIIGTNGVPTHYLAVKEDITERKQAETALRKSEARFRALFNQNHDGVYIIGLDGKTKDANQRGAEMFGYNIEELKKGKDRDDLIAPEIPSENVFARVLAGEHIPIFERMFRKKDGSNFPVEINLELVRDEDGTPLHLQIIVRDITERKQAEEKLRQQNEYLSILHQITLDLLDHRDLDELLQTVVDHAAILMDAPFSELMLEKDGELVVQTFTKNQEFLKGDRVGRAEAKLSWQAFDTKLPVVLDDYSAYSYRRDIYTETGLHAIAEFPVLIKDKCIGVVSMGRSQPEYAFSEMQVENGKLFAQLVALVLDSAQLFSDAQYEISERKRSEESLMLAHDQAVKANKLKSQLIAKVSHELRTPLSSVLGYAELLKYNIFGSELNPQQMDAADQIIDSVHYLTDIVNEFLDEAEIESRSLILDHQPFVIADVLKYVEATMSIIASEKGLALKTSLAPDVPETIWGDARRLQQVLINLTNNAIKFTRSGEVSIGIRCHSASHWALEVKDTGVGIPKDAQEIIFEPFTQIDNAITRENQGTGLGLTITKQLVELMNGRIFVESEVEKGSAFTIVLPIQHTPKTQ